MNKICHTVDAEFGTFTVLFTSVGRRVELMNSFRDSLLTLGIDGRLIATDVDPLAPAFHLVDEGFLVPRVESPDFIPMLIRICRDRNVDLVLPLIDPDIPLLAKNKSLFDAKVAVVDAHCADICGDKWLTYEFFRQHNVPTPDSWLPEALGDLPKNTQFPLFIRPRDGSAGKDAYKVNNRVELEFFCNYVPNAIVQQFIPGAEVTSDITCDFQGNILSVVSRKRIAVRGGEAMKSVTIKDEQITEYCCHVARSLNAVGPITVQCMMHGDQPKFIEINGRLGGGVPLAIAAGVDVPALLIAATLGLAIDRTLTDGYRTGLYMSRCDQSFFVTETQLDELSSDNFRS